VREIGIFAGGGVEFSYDAGWEFSEGFWGAVTILGSLYEVNWPCAGASEKATTSAQTNAEV